MIRYGVILLLFISFYGFGQLSPKREFRAVWVATVANIDWPSKPGLSTEVQQKEVIDILELHKKNGMNALILQIRPTADAFYPSELEPWSRYLTGTPGKAPNPFYDPLQFWIDECHRRNMEFHAWLNPYRVANNATEPLAASHMAFKHPEWIVNYGNKLYFDPGMPPARKFVVKVVTDIVSRYDVDAIHFDDYFYPYPLKEDFPDQNSFAKYNRGFLVNQKADWRRDNVDLIIYELSVAIKKTKPWVKFGISPFGVWRNKSDDPRGSDTKAGTTNYDQLNADILKWQENKWIDYCLPQLYWQIGHPTVDFQTLSKWWADNRFERAMYIGQAVYRLEANSTTPEWKMPEELVRQIEMIRSIPGLEGSAFFSSVHFNRDLMGFDVSLRDRFYHQPALIPFMPWIDNKVPATPFKLKKRGKTLKWKNTEATDEMDKVRAFVVYMNEAGKKFDANHSENIFRITTVPELVLHPNSRKLRKNYEVRVSAIDRLYNESNISDAINIKY